MLSNPGLPDCRAVQALSAAFRLQDAASRMAVGTIAPVRSLRPPRDHHARHLGRRARYKADLAKDWPRCGRGIRTDGPHARRRFAAQAEIASVRKGTYSRREYWTQSGPPLRSLALQQDDGRKALRNDGTKEDCAQALWPGELAVSSLRYDRESSRLGERGLHIG